MVNAVVSQQLFSGKIQFLQVRRNFTPVSLGALSGFASAILLQPRERNIVQLFYFSAHTTNSGPTENTDPAGGLCAWFSVRELGSRDCPPRGPNY